VVVPQNIQEALKGPKWKEAIMEEMKALIGNHTWDIVESPKDKKIVGCKWVFTIKYKSYGSIDRYKARLVAQGYNQEKGIDYDETYASVTRLEAIRMLLAFTCHINFKLYQMDVKSAFFDRYKNEEVYVEQPLDFENPQYEDYVYKLTKALYGLKQAPRARYEGLSKFLLEKGFKRR